MVISARRHVWLMRAGCMAALAAVALTVRPAAAETPPVAETPPPLTLDAAIRTALRQNPGIAAVRQEHGVAAAAVVIARAYPFNPLWEGRVRAAWPEFEGTTNPVPIETTVTLEMELRGQGKFRRAAAANALSRTDWDIAAQELTLAVRVVRAFDAVVYRHQKAKLAADTIELDQKTTTEAEDLVTAGKLRPVDLIILRTEIDDARAQLGQANVALATASGELHDALGVVGGRLFLRGDLAAPPLPDCTPEALTEAARGGRPDRKSREAAVAEADARLRLERANRFGNLVAGPTYEYDNSSIHNLGVQFALPLPALNAHRGDILQREAEKARAELDLRQTDVQIGLEVEAALLRLEHARAWATTYEKEVLPHLETSLGEVRQLFEQGDPSVDALRILDVQRKVLLARNGLLDARFEVRQAVADLAAALGDPSVAVGPCPAP